MQQSGEKVGHAGAERGGSVELISFEIEMGEKRKQYK